MHKLCTGQLWKDTSKEDDDRDPDIIVVEHQAWLYNATNHAAHQQHPHYTCRFSRYPTERSHTNGLSLHLAKLHGAETSPM